MQFRELILTDFKSYQGTHKFDFAGGAPGLHFVTGENLSEPDLEANGAGKSTLFDALFWGLYGRTTRGLKASNVHCWYPEAKTTAVIVELEVEGRAHSVARSWRPNKLTLDGNEVEQSKVDELVLNAQSFSHSVLLGQFSPFFFDLQPAQKLQLFTEILDADYWVSRSKLASDRHRTVERRINNEQAEIARLFGRIEQLEQQAAEYEKLAEEWEAREEQRKTELKKRLAGVDQNLGFQRRLYEQATQVKTQEAKQVREIKEETQRLRNAMETLEDNHKVATREMDKDSTVYERVFDEFERFGTVKDICPHCKQKVDPSHIEKERDRLSKELDELEAKIERQEAHCNEIGSQIDDFLADVQTREVTLREAEKRLQTAERQLSDASYEIRSLERQQTQIRAELAEDKPNEYLDLLEQCCDKQERVKEDIKEHESKIEGLERELAAAAYWVGGFKEVRLMVIEEALTALTIEVNNYLTQLGLKDWEVSFDVERETKAGTVSKGFNVFIHSPYHDEPVPWEANSGGESQRLQLAGALGLSNFILSSKGHDRTPLILDEPTQHLAKGGVDDMLALLEQKAREERRQIWLVDHHSLDYGGFATVTKIVKDKDGSRVVSVR